MDVPTTMKLKEGGPKENGRVWVSPEGMLSIEAAPGTHCLLSISSQKKEADEKLPTETGDLGDVMYPRMNVREAWGLDNGRDIGATCVGCEVWPNARLMKGEIQISQCLYRHLRHPQIGTVLYIQRYNPAQCMMLQSVHCSEKTSSIPSKQCHPSKDDRHVSTPPVCQKIMLHVVRYLEKDGGRDPWLEGTLKDGGHLQMDVLKTSICHQLHRRLMLHGNVVSVPLLGSTLLLSVDQLMTKEGSVTAALIDGDHLDIELQTTTSIKHDDAVLQHIRAAAEEIAEGSRKEAAIEGTLTAARAGLRALKGFSMDRCILSNVVQQTLRTSVILPLTSPAVFTSSGLIPPRGLILHGPPGGGKTLTAVWAAAMAKAQLFIIDGPSLLSEYYGAAEASLSGIFAAAKAVGPSLIFLDEMDALVPSRGETQGQPLIQDASIRLVTTLLTQFDMLNGHSVVVMGATNRLDAIDEALRRPGRFDREIEITVPDASLRQSLLKAQLKDIHHALKEQEITDLAFDTHGYLPADLSALCRGASLMALRRYVSQRGSKLLVTVTDFREAWRTVRPSGLREWHIDVPRVHWQDVGGLDDVKQQLKESVEWPLYRASALEHLGTSAPRGILLFGPPGCSKTMLAKAVATETGMNFIAVIGSELLSTFVGETEKAIARLFVRARQMSPCIIFVDEVDGLLSHRNESHDGSALGQRVLSQMLSEMDGIHDRGHVIVIAATNAPQHIDSAMLRPGRFDRLIFVPPPDHEARVAILKIQLRGMSIANDVDMDSLASKTEDYSGADLSAICREAGICALDENIEASHIHMRHFLQAIESSSPSLDGRDDDQMDIYHSFQRGSMASMLSCVIEKE